MFGFFPLCWEKEQPFYALIYHRSPHLTHSTGVLQSCAPKKEDGRSSLLDVFFHKKTKRNFLVGSSVLRLSLLCSRIRRSEKKQKNAPKHCILHHPKLIIGSLQSSKKATTTTTNGEQPSTLIVQSTDDHTRARERVRRFPPRVSLSNAPHPFFSSCGGVPPTPLLWGSNFQSKRRRRFRSPSRDERRANRRAATRANRQQCARVRANG